MSVPSTPLGPFADSAISWTTWVTLMGTVGLTVLALALAGAARHAQPAMLTTATVRLTRVAAVLGLLAFPALFTDMAHAASATGGYSYGAAWDALYDGSGAGWLSGLAVTLAPLSSALLVPVTVRRVAAGPVRRRLLCMGLACAAVALGTTKFPAEAPAAGNLGRTSFETLIWMLHLFGGAIWIGGLAGLLLLALPGVVPAAVRSEFWNAAIRRFSVVAMSCVAAIALSGLFLYWEHVDGPSQLVSTMYGRVLGVKILIFGALLLLGMANQFLLHPRIEALRAAGDDRPLHALLVRRFPAVIGLELVLGLTVLFVAPFLRGSARNQAFQEKVAKHAAKPIPVDQLPKLAPKISHASTWVWGTAETIVVIAVMVIGYLVSGRIARRHGVRGLPVDA